MSYIEDSFALMLNHHQLPPPIREHRFDTERKWRFDFAWIDQKIAVEIEGISWSSTRHQRLSGFLKDCEKYERALQLGWIVYRVPGPWIAVRRRDVRHIWRHDVVKTLKALLDKSAHSGTLSY